MKNEKIFGVDLTDNVTPIMVRDSIIECFAEAHCRNSEIGINEGDVNDAYCKEVVRKAFQDSGGNFNNPSKEDLIGAIEYLAEFSKPFRKPEIIKEHFNQIMELIEKI